LSINKGGNLRAIIIFLAVLLIFQVGIVRAESAFGLSGMVGWTNQDHAPSPLGLGIFLTHFISERFQLMFTADFMFESISAYETIIADFSGYYNIYGDLNYNGIEDPVTDMWNYETTLQTFEFAILYRVVNLYPTALDFGLGFNINFLNADITGAETGYSPGTREEKRTGLSLLMNFQVKGSERLPLGFHLGFRQRLAAGSKDDRQGYTAFESHFRMAEIWAGISYIIKR